MRCLRSSRTIRCLVGVVLVASLVPLAVAPAGAIERADAVGARAGAGADDVDGVRVTELSLATGDGPSRIAIDDPAQMAVLTGVAEGSEFAVRSRNGGTWSDWVTVETDDDRPDGRPGEEGTATSESAVGPIWLGRDAERLEVLQLGGAASQIEVELLDVRADDPVPVAAASGPSMARGSTDPASGPPFIAARASWATSEMTWQSHYAGCGSAPTINTELKAMVVHHTAGTSEYSPADVPGIIRGTWYYHARTNGWCDLAYNFVVDRFGRLWEGRQGGVDKLVRGGHTYGHNSQTQGIVQLGHFDTASSPLVMNDATGRLIGWKLGRHGVDPKGWTTLTNQSSSATSKGLAPGASIGVPTIIGHRDVGSTSCPGANTYARMGRIRDQAELAAHATALYRTFLGATPNAATAGPYAVMAATSGVDATADELVHSDRYAGLVVDDLYRRALGRTADASGRAYWIDVLRNGATVQDIGTSFYGSEEFFLRHGSADAFVDALYRNLLHRAPDAAGLRYWTEALDRGRATPPDVAYGFYASIESRRDRVSQVYLWVLGRSPDGSGREYWAEQVAVDGDLSLAVHLSLSEEYVRRNLR